MRCLADMNWVSSISFLKLMLMFSNCPARRSNRCFAIVCWYRRVFWRNRREQRNRNGSETTYLAYWLQPVQKEKDRVLRGFFLFPPCWPSLVSLQTTWKLPSQPQAHFKIQSGSQEHLSSVASLQIRSEFGRGACGLHNHTKAAH